MKSIRKKLAVFDDKTLLSKYVHETHELVSKISHGQHKFSITHPARCYVSFVFNFKKNLKRYIFFKFLKMYLKETVLFKVLVLNIY